VIATPPLSLPDLTVSSPGLATASRQAQVGRQLPEDSATVVFVPPSGCTMSSKFCESALLICLLLEMAAGFSVPARLLPHQRTSLTPHRCTHLARQHLRLRGTSCSMQLRPDGQQKADEWVHSFNKASKWAVGAASSLAVLIRRDCVSPYIVIGSVVSAFGTSALKRLIAQERPHGSPLTDPGMPSSHAVVSSFIAVAWSLHLRDAAATSCLLSAAATVSSLRVVCGDHTIWQSIVGLAIGSLSAWGWMLCFPKVLPTSPATWRVLYIIYAGASALFIVRKLPLPQIGFRQTQRPT